MPKEGNVFYLRRNYKKKINIETKRSIGFSWLISFLKILVIPMIALCAVYFKYDDRLEKQMFELNSYVFDRTIENVMNIMKDVCDIRISFCRGENFRTVMSIKEYDNYFSNPQVYSYIDDLKLSGMYNNEYLCYVYCQDTDCIISKMGILKSHRIMLLKRSKKYMVQEFLIQNHIDLYLLITVRITYHMAKTTVGPVRLQYLTKRFMNALI